MRYMQVLRLFFGRLLIFDRHAPLFWNMRFQSVRGFPGRPRPCAFIRETQVKKHNRNDPDNQDNQSRDLTFSHSAFLRSVSVMIPGGAAGSPDCAAVTLLSDLAELDGPVLGNALFGGEADL
ncbi:MAG: hypothetical protein IJJ85_03680, partial [Clostridia bacterium]|nr:hypothetical protein [Clostridia bacterium]